MKDVYCVYRDWEFGEFDIIVFRTLEEAEAFCEFNPDYRFFETSVLSLEEAKAIFA